MAISCFDLLDRHVITGRADQVALHSGEERWTYARLLEEVAAFGGVLRHCGVAPGDRVGVALPPSPELVVAVLACGRVGAEHDLDGTGKVAVTETTAEAEVVLVKQRGERRELVEGREYDWDVVMRAGRTDPAPVAEGAVLTPYDERTRALLEPLESGDAIRL